MTDFTPHEAPVTDVNNLPVVNPGRPVGRDEGLRDIYNLLQGRQAVLLYGTAGLGKTALAAALAAAYTNSPGGVIWLDARDGAFASLLVHVGRALNLTEITTKEQPLAHVGAVAAALTQQKPFIVLDNVNDALGVNQFIEKCADNLPVLLLSETELHGKWENVALEALSDMDAVTLFKQKAGINGSNADIDIFGITKLLDYQPLAIVIAARGMVAAKQAPSDYYKNLQQVQSSVGGDATTAAIALSYRALNNALQGLVLMLGATFRGEASVDYLSTISNVPPDTIQQATKILSQLYLIEQFERYGKPYYRLHSLVYDFAQNALRGKNQLSNLQQRVHDATLAYAQQYSETGQASPEYLAKEVDNFLVVGRWAADQGDRETANILVRSLAQADGFVSERGYVYELLRLREIASESTQAFRAYPEEIRTADLDDYEDYQDEDESIFDTIEDDPTIVPAEQLSADAFRTDRLQTVDLDQLQIALDQARQAGQAHQQVQILKAIGKVQTTRGQENEAISTYNTALELYDELDDNEGHLDTLNILAALLAKTHNSQAAVMHATQGLQLEKEVGAQDTRLQLLTSLGDAREDLGETAEAVTAFSEALEIARTTDDTQNEAIILYKLGYAYLDNSDIDDAIHSLEQARELFKTQEQRNYEGRVLGGLGQAHSELERWSEAIGYYQSALHIAREVSDKDEERLQFSNLAQAQVQAKRLPESMLSYRRALHLAYLSGQRDEIVSAIVDLVRLMLRSKRLIDLCDVLIQDAITLEPDDRDVNQLKEQINQNREDATARGIQQAPVGGTAQQYAANAYTLLEQ